MNFFNFGLLRNIRFEVNPLEATGVEAFFGRGSNYSTLTLTVVEVVMPGLTASVPVMVKV
jgi:hypothetical protein